MANGMFGFNPRRYRPTRKASFTVFVCFLIGIFFKCRSNALAGKSKWEAKTGLKHRIGPLTPFDIEGLRQNLSEIHGNLNSIGNNLFHQGSFPQTMQSNMKRILLLSSNGRSGSSLVAEMISSLTASVYFFEPFRYASQYHRHPLEKKDIYWEWAAHEMMENQTQTVRRMFQDLYNCEFSGFKHVILRDGDRFFIFRRPFEAYRQLLTYPEKIYMVNGMERMCFQSPNRMIKTIRIRLKTVVKTLDMRSMRLILLVRDPRAIINSMLQAPPGEVFRFNPDLATEVCMNLYEDIITYQSLPSNLSDSILLVRYEDILADTLGRSSEILEHLGLSVSPWAIRYFWQGSTIFNPWHHLLETNSHYFDLTRDFLFQADHWVEDIPPKVLRLIEENQYCQFVSHALGYEWGA